MLRTARRAGWISSQDLLPCSFSLCESKSLCSCWSLATMGFLGFLVVVSSCGALCVTGKCSQLCSCWVQGNGIPPPALPRRHAGRLPSLSVRKSCRRGRDTQDCVAERDKTQTAAGVVCKGIISWGESTCPQTLLVLQLCARVQGLWKWWTASLSQTGETHELNPL